MVRKLLKLDIPGITGKNNKKFNFELGNKACFKKMRLENKF
jgi:hypothetical protein